MTLRERLDALAELTRDQAPPGALEILDRSAEDRRQSGLANRVPRVGSEAPELFLRRIGGDRWDLDTVLARQSPTVVVFFQGTWCPYCCTQLATLEETLPELRAFGATLVVASPQVSGLSPEIVEKDFEIAIDEGNRSAALWGLDFVVDGELRELYLACGVDLPHFNGDDSWVLPLPGAFVVAPDRTILFSKVHADDRLRPEPSNLLDAVRSWSESA